MNNKRVLQCMVMIMLACMVSHGYAQLIRNFPIDSKFGKLKSYSYPKFKIDKKELVMGVGGQIRDVNNLLIMPTMLTQKGYIRYQVDNMGFLHRIWFLSPEEIKLAKMEEKLHKKQNSQKKFSIPFFQ